GGPRAEITACFDGARARPPGASCTGGRRLSAGVLAAPASVDAPRARRTQDGHPALARCGQGDRVDAGAIALLSPADRGVGPADGRRRTVRPGAGAVRGLPPFRLDRSPRAA